MVEATQSVWEDETEKRHNMELKEETPGEGRRKGKRGRRKSNFGLLRGEGKEGKLGGR